MTGQTLRWWWVVILALPLAAEAAGFSALAGLSVTSSHRTTNAVFASGFGEPAHDGRVHLAPLATVGWLDARHTHAGNLHHQVFLAGGGLRITAPRGHWFASEQLAATSHRTDALSSQLEFMTSGGWQRGHFMILLRHISNGHLIGHGKNLGETSLLAGVTW